MMPFFRDAQQNGDYVMAFKHVEKQLKMLTKYSQMRQFANDLDAAMLPLVSRPVAYDVHQCRKPLTWAYTSQGFAISSQAFLEKSQFFEDRFMSVETDPWALGLRLK